MESVYLYILYKQMKRPSLGKTTDQSAMAGEEGESLDTSSEPHFVLIHGLCGGAWVWFKIKCLLEHCYAYKVTCLDLRGCGTDPTDISTIQSFDDYNQPLEDFMAALPENDKVILVGYSAGGLSVTKVLHKFANKIQLVVYIAATMLEFGFQTPDDIRIGVPNFSGHGESLITCSLEEMTLGKMLARPGPPIGALQMATWPASEKITRVYIKTKRDRVLKPEQQEEMIRKWPPEKVYEIDSDHNPLFTDPLLLSGFLLKAVASFT